LGEGAAPSSCFGNQEPASPFSNDLAIAGVLVCCGGRQPQAQGWPMAFFFALGPRFCCWACRLYARLCSAGNAASGAFAPAGKSRKGQCVAVWETPSFEGRNMLCFPGAAAKSIWLQPNTHSCPIWLRLAFAVVRTGHSGAGGGNTAGGTPSHGWACCTTIDVSASSLESVASMSRYLMPLAPRALMRNLWGLQLTVCVHACSWPEPCHFLGPCRSSCRT
jgi:hypothetical protein